MVKVTALWPEKASGLAARLSSFKPRARKPALSTAHCARKAAGARNLERGIGKAFHVGCRGSSFTNDKKTNRRAKAAGA